MSEVHNCIEMRVLGLITTTNIEKKLFGASDYEPVFKALHNHHIFRPLYNLGI